MYLCRSLGSFSVLDGLPVLVQAARQENDPVEVQVRFSAIEAIATLADNCGGAAIESDPEAMTAILEASRVADDTTPPPEPSEDGELPLYRPHAELRAVAAYALGVVGGNQATTRLEAMLHDTYPNARYNAATGLARFGNQKCLPVLREMLDPNNALAVKDEINPNDQARKRTTVLLNGIKATLHFAAASSDADIQSLKQAIERLEKSPLQTVTVERSKVKTAANEALRLLGQR
jgi:HEAT repeat protein